MNDTHEHELLTRYYDGEIEYGELPPDLQHEVDAFAHAMDALAQERVTAPPSLKSEVMARITERRRVRRLTVGLAMAAGAAILILGWPSDEDPSSLPVRVTPIVAELDEEPQAPPSDASADAPPADVERSLLAQRLGPETEALVRPMFDAAQDQSLPVVVLERRALEGAAKGHSPEQIATALDLLAGQLGTARALLREGDPPAEPTDAEIIAAAYALDLGVPSGGVTRLVSNLSNGPDLEVPLVLLGDLVARGVAANDAGGIVVHLVRLEVPATQLAQIAPRLDVTLRVEQQPREALSRTLRGLGLPDLPPLEIRP